MDVRRIGLVAPETVLVNVMPTVGSTAGAVALVTVNAVAPDDATSPVTIVFAAVPAVSSRRVQLLATVVPALAIAFTLGAIS